MFFASWRASLRGHGSPASFRFVYTLLLIIPASAQQTSPAFPTIGIIVVDSANQADQILAQLKTGGDFAAIARRESVDATASDGGLIGKIDPRRLRFELRDALNGIAPGQVSQVVKIPEGFAILKILFPDGAAAKDAGNPVRILPLLATGAVKYTLSVSGRDEAESIFQSLPRTPESSQDLAGICRSRNDALAKVMQQLAATLASTDSLNLSSERIKMDYTEAQLYASQGNMEKAIEFWQDADRAVHAGSPRLVLPMEETLGIAYLHQSEMENHIYQSPGDRCIFPAISSPAYAVAGDSEKAVQYFLKYLQQKPDELEVKWLLNLAYMTLGRYPDGVPPEYLIPPSQFASKEQVARFADVAPAAGLGLVSMAGGVIVDDFDNDGQLDVVISSMDPCAPLHFFHNQGDGTFSERSVQAGLGDQLGGLNIVQADYNNDGCMDILVLRGGWEYPMRRSLLRNNCDGTFTDVTAASGLAIPATATQSAAWADIDNDGYLDLFIASERGPNQLFRNKGDGTFEDISHAAGIDQSIFTKGVTAADYDNDGYMDFYVSNFSGDNLLLHNNHNRTFSEEGEKAGVRAPWGSFATWFFD